MPQWLQPPAPPQVDLSFDPVSRHKLTGGGGGQDAMSMLSGLLGLIPGRNKAQEPTVSVTQTGPAPMTTAHGPINIGDLMSQVAPLLSAMIPQSPGINQYAGGIAPVNQGFIPSSIGFGKPLLPGTGNALAGGGGGGGIQEDIPSIQAGVGSGESSPWAPGLTGALNGVPLFSPYGGDNSTPSNGIQSFDWGNGPIPDVSGGVARFGGGAGPQIAMGGPDNGGWFGDVHPTILGGQSPEQLFDAALRMYGAGGPYTAPQDRQMYGPPEEQFIPAQRQEGWQSAGAPIMNPNGSIYDPLTGLTVGGKAGPQGRYLPGSGAGEAGNIHGYQPMETEGASGVPQGWDPNVYNWSSLGGSASEF